MKAPRFSHEYTMLRYL